MSVLDTILSRGAAAVGKPTNGHAAAPEKYVPVAGLRDFDTQAVPDFPLEVLPLKLREIIRNCNRYLSYPVDFTAASILSASGIALGRTHRIKYIWTSSCTMYLALVAPPGAMKSHPLKFALQPIIDGDQRAIKEFNLAVQKKAETGEDTSGMKLKKTLYGDFTIETLMRKVSENQRGVAVYLDELRAWFQNFNRYNSGSEQEFWLSNWSDNPITIDRKTSSIFLPMPGISVVGTIQPGMLETIGKGGRSDNGFVERMLFCYPEKVPVAQLKKRAEMTDTYEVILKPYRSYMEKLLAYNVMDELPQTDNERAGRDAEDDRYHWLYFTPEAHDELTDYLNGLMQKMDAIENESQRNIYAKIVTYTVRFCLLLQKMHEAGGELGYDPFERPEAQGDAGMVGTGIVHKAMKLTDYFLLHALKANGAINAATPVDRLPRNYQKWYRSLPFGEEFSAADAEKAAVPYDISRATVYNWLKQVDPAKRIFQRVNTGKYERLYF